MMIKISSLLFAVLVLAACASSTPPPVQSTPLPTVVTSPAPRPQSTATAVPVQGQTAAATPRAPAAATATRARPTAQAPTSISTPTGEPPSGQAQKFSDPTLGIALDYPDDWKKLPRAADAPPGLTLGSPSLGQGPEPIIFAITIDIHPVEEKTVQEVVDQQLGEVPTDLRGGIQLADLTVGGEPAKEVIGLPSSAGALETFVMHRNQVYLIILQPYDEHNESLQPYLSQVREVYDGLLASWKFLK